jgi:hypothetical protein
MIHVLRTPSLGIKSIVECIECNNFWVIVYIRMLATNVYSCDFDLGVDKRYAVLMHRCYIIISCCLLRIG